MRVTHSGRWRGVEALFSQESHWNWWTLMCSWMFDSEHLLREQLEILLAAADWDSWWVCSRRPWEACSFPGGLWQLPALVLQVESPGSASQTFFFPSAYIFWQFHYPMFPPLPPPLPSSREVCVNSNLHTKPLYSHDYSRVALFSWVSPGCY